MLMANNFSGFGAGGDCDPYFDYVTYLLPFNGTLTNYGSAGGFTSTDATGIGGTTESYAAGVFDQAVDLGPSRIYASYIPSVHDWWIVPYTIDSWVYCNAFNEESNYSTVSPFCGNAWTGFAYLWTFGPRSNGILSFYYFNGSAQVVSSATNVLSLNTWHYIRFTHNAGTINLYCDGVCVASAAVAGTPQSNATYPFRIGSVFNTIFDGRADDFRITRGIARSTGSSVGVKYFDNPTSELPKV